MGTLLLLPVVLTGALAVAGPAVPAASADSAALTSLVNEFLAGASRNDAAVHDRFWADDLVYTGSAGRRRGKAELMRDVRSTPAAKPGDPATTFTAEDVVVHPYRDTAVVAFRLVASTLEGGKTSVTSYLNTGTFVKRDGRWQAVAWQATKMAPPDAATPKPEPGTKAEDAAQAAAESWLGLVDQGEYAASWDQAAGLFKGAVSAAQWAQGAAGVRGPLGKVISRKVRSRQLAEKLPGAPDGKYVVIQFDTVFENKATAVETVTPMLDPDGAWRVSGYFVR